jgi:hypothetical protein
VFHGELEANGHKRASRPAAAGVVVGVVVVGSVVGGAVVGGVLVGVVVGVVVGGAVVGGVVVGVVVGPPPVGAVVGVVGAVVGVVGEGLAGLVVGVDWASAWTLETVRAGGAEPVWGEQAAASRAIGTMSRAADAARCFLPMGGTRTSASRCRRTTGISTDAHGT